MTTFDTCDQYRRNEVERVWTSSFEIMNALKAMLVVVSKQGQMAEQARKPYSDISQENFSSLFYIK